MKRIIIIAKKKYNEDDFMFDIIKAAAEGIAEGIQEVTGVLPSTEIVTLLGKHGEETTAISINITDEIDTPEVRTVVYVAAGAVVAIFNLRGYAVYDHYEDDIHFHTEHGSGVADAVEVDFYDMVPNTRYIVCPGFAIEISNEREV